MADEKLNEPHYNLGIVNAANNGSNWNRHNITRDEVEAILAEQISWLPFERVPELRRTVQINLTRCA